MHNLDDLAQIKTIDKGHILESIYALPKQIAQVEAEFSDIKIPKDFNFAKNVCILGMGGSALGGRIIDSLCFARSRVPIEVFNEYQVPSYVNSESLVIVSSYSGNTEETVNAAYEASQKKAMIFGITSGGKLQDFLLKEKIASYIFTPKNNPSNQPRMALGYSIMAILLLLSKSEFIVYQEDEIKQAAECIKKYVTEYEPLVSETHNLAKKIAKRIFNYLPILVASEHLVGIAHAFKNQLNENAKTFSDIFDIPELNHHLLEGLKFPRNIKPFLYFLFFQSNLYSPRVSKRYPITEEVVKENSGQYEVYIPREENKLGQIFEILVLTSFISFYLAILNDIDPAPIPWVDYFKSQL